MRNRFRWRDGADDLMLAVSKMSDKELEQRARLILEAKADPSIKKETIYIDTLKEKNASKK